MNFKQYKNTKDLKGLSSNELKNLSSEIRGMIYNQIINEEGHLGSNMAIVDLTLSLLKKFGNTNVRYLFDTSYQAYAFKMLTGRKDFLNQIHTPNGYNVFQEIEEGDPYSGGHTSISSVWASGYNTLKDNTLNIEIIGDGSLATSIGLGGMLNFAKTNSKNLFIMNDNKQGIGVNQFNYIDWSKVAEGMNYEFYEVKNGHDYEELEKAWDFFDKAQKNVFVKVNTIKGYGLEIPNKEEAFHYFVKPNNTIDENYVASIRYLINDILSEKLKNSKTMIFIPGMTYVFGLSELKKKFPNQIIDAGIAEEISIVEAAAAANSGKDVYFIVSSSFSQRVYDQIIHDIMRNHLKMHIIITGINVSPFGDSHHGIYDLNMYNGFENIEIFQPTTTIELNEIINQNLNGTKLIRLEGKLEKSDDLTNVLNWKWTVKNSSKIAIISYGVLANDLSDYVKENKIDVNVIKATSLNPLDENTLEELFKNNFKVFTYEPVFWKNNLASSIRAHFPNNLIRDFAFNKPIIGKWDIKSIYKENNMNLEYVFKTIFNK